jgi:queuine tRNA-ribosyltransferase
LCSRKVLVSVILLAMSSDVNSRFTNVSTDGLIRTGILHSRSGDIYTPTFMPDATRGAVKSLEPSLVANTGVQMILCNTYHLHLQPGEAVVSSLGGLHEFTHWPGPILTDSGGFQVFSLANIRKISEDGVTFRDPRTGDEIFLSPEISIQIQLKLGSDILVAFDDVTALDKDGRLRTRDALDRTHRWLSRSIAEFQKQTKGYEKQDKPLLFGVVQGGLDKDLRRKSLKSVQELPVDGIAIGGLSVGETRAEMQEILKFLAPLYDHIRPRFLLGVGDPIDLRFAIEHGIDMLDCVLPTRNARHATAWVNGDKKIHLMNAQYIDDPRPIDDECDCTTCLNGYSRGFLCHQFKVKEPLAGSLVSIHNLRYLLRICESYKN